MPGTWYAGMCVRRMLVWAAQNPMQQRLPDQHANISSISRITARTPELASPMCSRC